MTCSFAVRRQRKQTAASSSSPSIPPITKGLQERIHEFGNIDEPIELKPIIDHLAALPSLDLAYSEETEARIPELAGGISVALARTFKIIDPALKNRKASMGALAAYLRLAAVDTCTPAFRGGREVLAEPRIHLQRCKGRCSKRLSIVISWGRTACVSVANQDLLRLALLIG